MTVKIGRERRRGVTEGGGACSMLREGADSIKGQKSVVRGRDSRFGEGGESVAVCVWLNVCAFTTWPGSTLE